VKVTERANPHFGEIEFAEMLENKVAMLFNSSNEEDRTLAVSLAGYGVDIAIAYREGYAQHAYETKKLVEAEGRRCLIVPAHDKFFSKDSEDVIGQTIEMLGRLDIFIDMSSLPEENGYAADSGEDTHKEDCIE
jgi:hypothetical protein